MTAAERILRQRILYELQHDELIHYRSLATGLSMETIRWKLRRMLIQGRINTEETERREMEIIMHSGMPEDKLPEHIKEYLDEIAEGKSSNASGSNETFEVQPT